MPKRNTDTEIWREDWFIDISKDCKLAWFYIKDSCDYAGIWKPNISIFNKLCECNLTLDDLFSFLNKDKKRIIKLKNGNWFLVGYIPFQYGKILNISSPFQNKIYNLLLENQVDISDISPLIEIKKCNKKIERVSTGCEEGVDRAIGIGIDNINIESLNNTIKGDCKGGEKNDEVVCSKIELTEKNIKKITTSKKSNLEPKKEPSQEIVDIWNGLVTNLPKKRTSSKQLNKLWIEAKNKWTIDEIKQAITKANETVFLIGHKDKWQCRLEFFLRDTADSGCIIGKILEGFYDRQFNFGEQNEHKPKRDPYFDMADRELARIQEEKRKLAEEQQLEPEGNDSSSIQTS